MQIPKLVFPAVVFGCVFVASVHAAQSPHSASTTGYCEDVELDQGWSCEQREDFWFRPQGSRMLPYAWFLSLEQARSTTLFRSDIHMDALRFLPAPKSTHNPDALPVGFAKDPAKCMADSCWVGLTCAACHTARIDFNGRTLIVDGDSGMLDFSRFLDELVKALDATARDSDKFARFANAVLGPKASEPQRDRLYQQLQWRTCDLRQRAEMNHSASPYGFARVDAFGAILNQVLVHDLDLGENVARAGAPVSYPCLWDTPQHDKVQWNGTGLSGRLGLLRNIGEVIGVFGTVDITPRFGLPPVYRSSVRGNIDNLQQLEKLVSSLSSPVWPRSLATINQAKADTGRLIYDKECKACHEFIDRKDPLRHVTAKMVRIEVIGTDATMAQNYANRTGDTGRLEGTPKFLTSRFGPVASGEDILSNVIVGVASGAVFHRSLQHSAVNYAHTRALISAKPLAYKARPLNGVWATAPYLHNGSVLNLWELLQRNRASKFEVGDRTFDPVRVGFVSSGGFVFDTTLPGNSNAGHAYGLDLSDSDKWALIEFLKTL